jgi:lipoprotein-releasing system permease protein
MQRNAVTGLSVQVRDIDRVGEVKDVLQGTTGYRSETWEEGNAQILAFQGRQQMTSRILVIIVFITAAFGISNTLVAIVLQKRQDIAVMKSFGVSRRDVARVFLLEGVMIGLIGGILAALLGYGLATLFGRLDLFPANNDRAYIRFDRFPVSLDYSIYLFTFALSLLMAVAASFFPARRAAKFIPVKILREKI